MQKYCKKYLTIIRVFCRELKMRVPWLANSFKKNITVGFLSPAFSGFQNKDDFLYAHCCSVLCIISNIYRDNKSKVTHVMITNILIGIS